jgi:hypothetical protein
VRLRLGGTSSATHAAMKASTGQAEETNAYAVWRTAINHSRRGGFRHLHDSLRAGRVAPLGCDLASAFGLRSGNHGVGSMIATPGAQLDRSGLVMSGLTA